MQQTKTVKKLYLFRKELAQKYLKKALSRESHGPKSTLQLEMSANSPQSTESSTIKEEMNNNNRSKDKQRSNGNRFVLEKHKFYSRLFRFVCQS